MMYLGTKNNGNFYGIESISYTYDNQFMTEDQIRDMFRDVEDCCGVLFGLYCDTENIPMEQMIHWLYAHKYIVIREFKKVN